jgi:hypothetical protein
LWSEVLNHPASPEGSATTAGGGASAVASGAGLVSVMAMCVR